MTLKSSTEVVVIGGGLIGCSIAYHLTKLGCTDVMLLERSELTSGSTWHAAAGVHGLHDNSNITKLQNHTMQVYKELEIETEQSCGIHENGIIYLAQTEDREHQLRIQAAKAKLYNIKFEELSLEQVRELHPLVNLDGIRCAFMETNAGHVDPSGVTFAYAKGAKQNGAEIHRFTPVTATTQQDDGSWIVSTPKGDIHTQVVVNVAGLWGREVAKLAGFELPLMTMEHQYFVTESMPGVEAHPVELPSIADRDGEYYLRQENQGLLVGAYEKDGRFWAEEGTPLDFGHELLNDDLERIEDNMMAAINRIPELGEAGIKSVINGPMIWSPDSSALFGPVPELENYYCCNGIIPGFSQSAGLGLLLAQWIVDGEPEMDMFAWDLARFDDWADRDFAKARALDCYSHRFKIHFPYEEREAGRPARMRPAYGKQKDMGAVFGLNGGWEHPLWYAQDDVEPVENYGFKRQNWHAPVGDECRALRNSAGVIDISNFAKYEVKGPGAESWINHLVANKAPTEIGRTCLAPLLSLRGGIAGDFTITKLADDHYMMFGSGMAERFHKRYFKRVPLPADTSVTSLTNSHCGFSLAGPSSRAILQLLAPDQALDNANFPFMRSRQMQVAGIDSIVLRVSFSGELGYEIYTAEDNQVALYEAILKAGKEHQIRPVGGRALLSLRVEKGYGSWGREYSTEYWPQEVGLERLIKLDKSEDFIGKQAYMAIKDNPAREKLVMLSIDTPFDADASGGEPIFAMDGTPVGKVSSGAYGHTLGQSLALAFINSGYLGQENFNVAILGLDHPAKLLAEPPFDPQGQRLRS